MADRLATEAPSKRARSVSPSRERGRTRSRDEPKRRISRSHGRPSQKAWALNPMVSVNDTALEAASAEDESFRDAVARARGSSPESSMDRLRSASPPSAMERLSASSGVVRGSYSGGDVQLLGKPGKYHVTSSCSGRGGSLNAGPYQPSSPDSFLGRKLKRNSSKPPPELELALSAQKSEDLVLNIEVSPPSPRRSRGKSVMGRLTLDGFKRSSRSATEATAVVAGTQCSECKTLIPGTFDVGHALTCTNDACAKPFKVGESLLLAECPACLTWANVPRGLSNLKCHVCGNDVELLPTTAAEPAEPSRQSASEQVVDSAVHGLLSAWEMIRAGAQALLPNPVKSVYINWSGTIVTDFSILEPRCDDDIRKLIFEAQAAGLTLRVLGHGHTQSPAVCGNFEPGVLLMRLNKYRQPTSGIPDFQWLNGDPHTAPTHDVRVNAGWSLAQLYAEIVPKGYFLFSQTAACPFSIGGFYMNSVHGSAHEESLISTRCVALRVIKYDGAIVTISRDKDMRMWRSNFGAGGVTTHVTIRLRRFTSIENGHVKYQLELTPEKVQSCIFASMGDYHACEFFWDPYSNDLAIARWRGRNDGGVSNFEKRTRKRLHRDSLTFGLPIGGGDFVQLIPEHVSCFQAREANMKAGFAGLEHFLRKDAAGSDTMFLVDWVPRCVFMAYFVPVKSAWDVLRAIQAVTSVVQWGRDTNQAYGIDCPVEFRFVRGNSNAVFTPLWEQEDPDSKEDSNSNFPSKQLYMNIEIIAYTDKLDVKFAPHSHVDNPVTASFQEFWYRVEQNWRAIPGAKPHPAKLFGLEPRPGGGYRAFAPQYLHELWSPKQKKWIRKWLRETDPPGVFERRFLKQLLAEPSPLDLIDGESILVHAVKLPDATHSEINNINDYRGCWFLFITLPYWLSGMLIHSAGLLMLVVLVCLGVFQNECNQTVQGFVVRDCSVHPQCTENALHWIQAWFLYRGLVGLLVAPFHFIINLRRMGLLCLRFKRDATQWSKPNSDDNSKMFWRCVPICDIMISFTLGFGMVSMQHMYECGLSGFFAVEFFCLLILTGVLSTRMIMRLSGQYYRFFHYNGNGSFFAQKSIKGSWNPWHRLTDRKFL